MKVYAKYVSHRFRLNMAEWLMVEPLTNMQRLQHILIWEILSLKYWIIKNQLSETQMFEIYPRKIYVFLHCNQKAGYLIYLLLYIDLYTTVCKCVSLHQCYFIYYTSLYNFTYKLFTDSVVVLFRRGVLCCFRQSVDHGAVPSSSACLL